MAARDEGLSRPRVAARFGVSVGTVQRYDARRRATGSVAATVQRHGPRPVKTQALHAWLPARLERAADATLAEHVAALAEQEQVVVSTATMWRAIESSPPPTEDGAHLTPTGRVRRPGASLKQRP